MPPTKLRPRDAASLALVRLENGGPQVLMGRRHSTHAFMPDVFVFPGGSVEPGDAREPAASELRSDVERHLTKRCSKRRARALAMAAIRETFEEAGLALGKQSAHHDPQAPATWQAFALTGLAPALDRLDYLGRAITPPGQVRRFHARFFTADVKDAEGELSGDGELLDLDFYPLARTESLPTASITRLVLKALARHIAEPPGPNDPRPYFSFHDEKSKIIYE